MVIGGGLGWFWLFGYVGNIDGICREIWTLRGKVWIWWIRWWGWVGKGLWWVGIYRFFSLLEGVISIQWKSRRKGMNGLVMTGKRKYLWTKSYFDVSFSGCWKPVDSLRILPFTHNVPNVPGDPGTLCTSNI